MGNCAGSASRHAAPWATGDGELVSPPGHEQEKSGEVRTGVEVTIRISKRRLQELLMVKAAGRGEEVMAEKMLAEIVRAGEVVELHRCRRWEPELQSIPEAVES